MKYLPERLQALGFADQGNLQETVVVAPPPYGTDIDAVSKVRNAAAIRKYSITLANTIKQSVQAGQQPVVVGGDCSILLGCMLGLKSLGQHGLFFLDGHTDYMWPEHSSTNGAAGMDLALVTGNGDAKLTNINDAIPYVKEDDVFCCGNREYDEEYVQLIKQSEIHYYDLAALRQQGLATTAVKFLQMVEDHQLKGFWIHLDVDVLDNKIMPAVDSPQKGGLSYAELRTVLLPLLSAPNCKGIDITILDPTLDEGGVAAKAFVENISGILRDSATAGL